MEQERRIVSLDGEWDFFYRMEGVDRSDGCLPTAGKYDVRMPVPGYWDDHWERFRYTDAWSRGCRFNPEYRKIDEFPLGLTKPPDASLPFLVGTGWYRRTFQAEEDWEESCVTLHIGGVTMEAWIWLNGQWIGHHVGHLTPFEFSLNEALKPGQENELIIAVSNTRTDRTGCSIRGYKGRSAGITRSVFLKVSRKGQIRDCFVCADETMQKLKWEITVDGWNASSPMEVRWEIFGKRTRRQLAQGREKITKQKETWSTDSFGMKPWSDRTPVLYELRLTLFCQGAAVDVQKQTYGFRRLGTSGCQLLLNGNPIFLRGATDHAYFPKTCTVPTDPAYYRDTLGQLKRLGFNWIRFHTWTPPEECMDAADELGMLLQVEAPNGFEACDWLDIIKTCRRHPSVAIYCCGNEVAMDAAMLAYLEEMAGHVKRLAPDCLFNPMEGLRGIEYELDETEPGFVKEPYPHNAEKLKRLDGFSDVYAPHGSIFSYHSLATDQEQMETRLSVISKPGLMHEVCIVDSFLNLDLEHRYEGTRIGTDLFAAARRYLRKKGMLENAGRYYQNSCRWMKQVIKYAIEQARRCDKITGYDMLGAIDCHWHRSGYAVGLMNEFYELKAGMTQEEILRFNGESVLLADCGTRRNIWSGETLTLPVYVSLYGRDDWRDAKLSWKLMDEQNRVYAGGERQAGYAAAGGVSRLGTLELSMPQLAVPMHLILQARLSGETYELENKWDFWCFPKEEEGQYSEEENSSCTNEVKIRKQLEPADLLFMEEGGRILLMGGNGLPTIPTTFQPMSGGRVQGNNATVVYDHPVTRRFPHEGYCDWQFFSMMEGGEAVVFEDLPMPFEPIVELVSGYKLIRRQASLFEWRVGKGGVMVCAFHMAPSDPGAAYLQRILMRYLASDAFAPKVRVSAGELEKILETSASVHADFTTDEGYDDGGHVKNV